MPRKLLYRSKVLPYHVVNQVNNREWFHLAQEDAWQLLTRECFGISLLCGAEIHAFVMMSNHFHMLVSTPHLDLGETMRCFGGSVTQSYNRRSGRVGHLFRGRYQWSLIDSPLYYAHATKYIYRNPVRAGIAKTVEEYPYSTLHGLMGHSHLSFPLYVPPNQLSSSLVPQQSEHLLRWLNTPFKVEDQEAIRKGLRRRIFELPKVGLNRSPSPLTLNLA